MDTVVHLTKQDLYKKINFIAVDNKSKDNVNRLVVKIGSGCNYPLTAKYLLVYYWHSGSDGHEKRAVSVSTRYE